MRRLGLKSNQAPQVQISHIWRKCEGGILQVIDALRGCEDETARKFITKYDSLPKSVREVVTIEQISTSAGVLTPDLHGCAAKALVSQQQQASAFIAATAHPLVMQKTVQVALQDKGVRDREMVHTMVGALPTPKGTTIISQRFQIANLHEPEKTVEVEGPADLIQFDEDISALHRLSNTGRTLALPENVRTVEDRPEVARR